jgi:hypothetical protein
MSRRSLAFQDIGRLRMMGKGMALYTERRAATQPALARERPDSSRTFTRSLPGGLAGRPGGGYFIQFSEFTSARLLMLCSGSVFVCLLALSGASALLARRGPSPVTSERSPAVRAAAEPLKLGALSHDLVGAGKMRKFDQGVPRGH